MVPVGQSGRDGPTELRLGNIDVDIESLTHTSGEWLRATGPESDIVMSSRIRLARNLAQFPFPNRADDSVRSEVE